MCTSSPDTLGRCCALGASANPEINGVGSVVILRELRAVLHQNRTGLALVTGSPGCGGFLRVPARRDVCAASGTSFSLAPRMVTS